MWPIWNSYSDFGLSGEAHPEESLDEHGKNTLKQMMNLLELNDFKSADFSEEFLKASAFISYFHDLGKGLPEFQEGLLKIKEGREAKLPHHAKEGWEILISEANKKEHREHVNRNTPFFKNLFFLSTIIARHHSNLRNLSEYDVEDRQILKNARKWLTQNRQMDFFFLYRMAYSLVVNADRRSSAFGGERLEKNEFKLEEYFRNFRKYLEQIKGKGKISEAREKFRIAASEKAKDLCGKGKRIYYLYLPTGGGKTLTSLSAALEIAKKKKLKRIHYVFPYISIIEQNSAVLKNIFGEDVSPLHSYSTITKEGDDESEDYRRLVRIESMDYPAVVMSSARFFDILFSNRKKSVMCTWALRDSVIIIDEIQYIPKKFWKVISPALDSIAKTLNCHIILMSATLPRLDEFLEERGSVGDLIENGQFPEEFKIFDGRIETRKLEGSLEDADMQKITGLIEEEKADKSIIVANEKKTSYEIYLGLMQEKNKYKLMLLNGTTIYPRRMEILEEFQNSEGGIILVSTQSIEAGMDIDADLGIRAYSPFESIMQVGGRVNRNGKKEKKPLYVFEKTKSRIYSQEFGYLRIKSLGSLTTSLGAKATNLGETKYIDKYYDKMCEKLGKISTEGDRLKEGIKSFAFERVGESRIIENVQESYSYPGKIRIKDSYSISGGNRIDVAKKIAQTVRKADGACGSSLSNSIEQVEEGLIMDPMSFAEEYSHLIGGLQREEYEKRVQSRVYLRELGFAWSMFSFNCGKGLPYYERYGINWVEEDFYDAQLGVKFSSIGDANII
ncbi:MAG: CRISPR-associated helicase Cas3' [Candidatus Aminicenantaceae bacterium]